MNRRIRMIALFAAIAVVAAVLSYGCNAMIAGRADKANAGLISIEKRCAAIGRETDSAKAELDQRQWQDQLAKASGSWLSVVNSAVNCLPDDVWVTRVETSPKDSTLLIEGRAATYDSLSAFIGGLHRNPAFSDIRLGSVRIVRIGNLTCLDFSVPIKLSSSAAASGPAPAAQANAQVARRPGA